MISSGKKRGLAAVAVSALAVAGLPFIASPASAAAGDVIDSATVGPVRNGGSEWATVVLKTKNVAETEIALANQALSAVGAGSANTPTQSVVLGTATIAVEGSTGDSTKNDGFDEITVPFKATTAAATDDVKFALYAETGTAGAVNADEARIMINTKTAGAPAQVDISNAQPATVASAPVTFNVEVKDASGAPTQLTTGESFAINNGGGTAAASDAGTDGSLDATEFTSGKAKFAASWTAGGTKTVSVTGNGGATGIPATVTDSTSVTVYDNASISNDEFQLETGADTWVDGTTTFGTATQVRVDQNSVTFKFEGKDKSGTVLNDAGKAVVLQLSTASLPGDVKIDGKSAKTQPVTAFALLDSEGKGEITVALSDVTDGAQFTFAGTTGPLATPTTVTMKRAEAATAKANQSVYVSKVGAPTDVTVTVKDQFGNPTGAPAQVAIVRNTGSTPNVRPANTGSSARADVNAEGQAAISLPDAGTAPGVEVIDIVLYKDQYDGTGTTFSAASEINYTADGLGADFTVSGASATDAALTKITPLYDATASAGTSADTVKIDIAGATPGTSATVTVDNDALVLDTSGATLDKGAASKTITLTGGTGSVWVVGTKTGVVNVKIESGGREKTVKLTVAQDDTVPTSAALINTARNVEIEAPESAKAGEVAVWTATVTDAFGNPVPGVSADSGATNAKLSFIVSGPGNIQSTDAVTDANGQLKVNVLLTDNANSQVSVRATGTGGQFGSAADKVGSTAAPGLSASVSTAVDSVTDVVNIAALEAAVAVAQTKVDNASDNLAEAQGELAVAQAQLDVAKAAVKDANKDVKQAKKALKQAKKAKKNKAKKVRAAKKNLKAAKKVKKAAKGDRKIAKAAVNAKQISVDNAQQRLDDATAELEAAQAALDEAQGGDDTEAPAARR